MNDSFDKVNAELAAMHKKYLETLTCLEKLRMEVYDANLLLNQANISKGPAINVRVAELIAREATIRNLHEKVWDTYLATETS